MLSRAIVEGLFGLHPVALADELLIRHGFPSDWTHASLKHPAIDLTHARDDQIEVKSIRTRLAKGNSAKVNVNGQIVEPMLRDGYLPLVEIFSAPAGQFEIKNAWRGNPPYWEGIQLHFFPICYPIIVIVLAGFQFAKFEPVNLAPCVNDHVTEIFRPDKYLSPRWRCRRRASATSGTCERCGRNRLHRPAHRRTERRPAHAAERRDLRHFWPRRHQVHLQLDVVRLRAPTLAR